MLKLYRFTDHAKEYWETWDDGDGSHSVHWGELGTQGSSRRVTSSAGKSAREIIQAEVDTLLAQGYAPIDPEDHAVLLIEYPVQGMGSHADLDKRHRLEGRMNETLGWTGLGECDGGSIGSGTMEVCLTVVDAGLAKRIVEADLKDSEFSDFIRIYDEDAE